MTLSRDILEGRLRSPFRYFDSVGSSNDLARDWLLEGAPSGAAIIADEQTQGRGQRDRSWVTPPGCALALSIILHPPEALASRIMQVGALAVYDLAESLGCDDVGIKPRNDVLIQGKKMAGILPEAVWDGARLRGVILGIGLNVRLDFAATELRDSAISLETVLCRRLNRADLLAYLLYRVMHWRGCLESETIMRAWNQRLLRPEPTHEPH